MDDRQDPAHKLWKAFRARSNRYTDIFFNNRTRICEALTSPFLVSLASGGLKPENFNLHVAGVLQIFGSIATIYTRAEEATRLCGNVAIANAIAALRTGLGEEYTSISDLYPQNSTSLSTSPDYCSFVIAKISPTFPSPEYAAFLLASANAFMRLSYHLAKKLNKCADPTYLDWIERYASERFKASCVQTDQVFNDLCHEANCHTNFGGSMIGQHYIEAMKFGVQFFASHVAVTVEECAVVPLTREHDLARDQIVIGCGLDRCCCYSRKDFENQICIPIVPVGFIYENVLNCLADFHLLANGVNIEKVEVGEDFKALLLTIDSSKEICNANIHVLANDMKSAESSGCMDRWISHKGSRHEMFKDIARNHTTKKVLSIYIGQGVDDLGALIEADIGIVQQPCPELQLLTTQFGLSIVPLWEALVQKQKQMRTGIDFLWRSKTGTLYEVKSLDKVTSFIYGAICGPETKSEGRESSSLTGSFSILPEPKLKPSSYFSLLQAQKPEIYGTSSKPMRPSKTEKAPFAVPKPNNQHISADCSNVREHKESPSKSVLDFLSSIPKPKNTPEHISLEENMNFEKQKAQEPDRPSKPDKVEKLEIQAEAIQKVEKEENVSEDENENVKKDEDLEEEDVT